MRRYKENDLNTDLELGLRELEGEDVKGHRKAVLVSGEICRKVKAENITGRVANSKGSAKKKAISKRQHEREMYKKQLSAELDKSL